MRKFTSEKIIDRLAEYENTGLTLEEIKALQSDNEKLHRLIDDIESVLSKRMRSADNGKETD